MPNANLQDNVQDAQQIIYVSVLPLIERFTTPDLAYQAPLSEISRDLNFGSPLPATHNSR